MTAPLEAHRFLNAVRIIHGLDEVADVLSPAEVAAFHHSPVEFLLRADDAKLAAIWQLVERRQPPGLCRLHAVNGGAA